VQDLIFYGFILVIYGPVMCALVYMSRNNHIVITDGETFHKATVENASNLKGKCWDCLVKTVLGISSTVV